MRYYTQSAADFYHDPPFPEGFVAGQPYTADTRLSAFGAITAGLRLAKSFRGGVTVDVRAELLSAALRVACRRERQPRSRRILRAMDRVRTREAVLTAPVSQASADGPPWCYAFRAMAARARAAPVDGRSARTRDRAARVAIADVLRIEAKFTRYRDDSVTSAINRAAGAGAVAIDAETVALLRYADQCHALSGGRFDLTSGVLRRAWDFKRRPPLVPTDDEIAAARDLVGWDRVEWNDRSIRLPIARHGARFRRHRQGVRGRSRGGDPVRPRHRARRSSTSAATCAQSARVPMERRGASASAIRAMPKR